MTEGYSVQRAMQAMEVLAFRAATAPEVAGALRIHPRTARRLLNRLVADGWLTRTDGQRRRYAPTLRIVALAAHLVERAPLAVLAAPEVDALARAQGAPAQLFIPSYRSALCLVAGAGGESARPAIRELVPAHAHAAGQVLLAHREAWRDSVFELPLERLTARTVTDPAAHRAAAPRIVERGFARDAGEYRDGLASVAAPVWGAGGDVVAALSVVDARDAPDRAGALAAHHAGRLTAALAAAQPAVTSSG